MYIYIYYIYNIYSIYIYIICIYIYNIYIYIIYIHTHAHTYLNEGDKVCVCYSCLKMVKQAHLYVGFATIFFSKCTSHKRFYLYLNC